MARSVSSTKRRPRDATVKRDYEEADYRDVKDERNNVRGVDESEQRRRYGGFNFGAAFFGWVVASGIGVMLTALLTALGTSIVLSRLTTATGVQSVTSNLTSVNPTAVSFWGGVLLLIIWAVAYYAGGYVAGRLSRFDGARQGVGAWIFGIAVTLLFAILGAIFGAKYNILQGLNLPHLAVNGSVLTRGGIIASLLILAIQEAKKDGIKKAPKHIWRLFWYGREEV